MRFRTLTMAAAVASAAVWAVGCASGGQASSPKPKVESPTPTAKLESRSGSAVTGTATFTELTTGGVRVHVHVENAAPGSHGLHIHDKGDCSAPDATSAGGHFNPSSMPHAAPSAEQRHAGDLGNIEIGPDGKGDLDITSNMLSVKPGPNSVLGRAVIFHEKTDDFTTQPTGNAGARFACGMIN